MNTNNAFLNAQKQLKDSFEFLKNEYSNNFLEYILNPKRVIEVNIPVKMDDWSIKNFVWYRSQHSNARWPFKGWIRFHQDVTIDEVKALSIWMSIKTWVVDLPIWWWKGWIIVDPKTLSLGELERLSRGYVEKIINYIWPDIDIPAPDVNTNWQIMAWMTNEYQKLTQSTHLGTFTWKPLTYWGSLWRDKATAQWWLFVLQKYLELENINISWKKISVQWLWNAWLTFLKLVKNLWVKVVWVSDSKIWIIDENWIDIDKIILLKESKLWLDKYEFGRKVWPKDVLEVEADILVPAALENQITLENVWKIKSKIILELANWPVTPESEEILNEKNIVIIPDILANSWWVMVSYFEQVQNNSNFYWDLEEVDSRLYKKITNATNDVWNISKQKNTNLRNWAYIIALKRIFDVLKISWELQ